VPAAVLIVPVATAGAVGGTIETGKSEMVRLADLGRLAPSHNAPQLFAIGQLTNRLTGALNTAPIPGGITTVDGTALARTIVFKQAVCDTTQAEFVLPPQAEINDWSEAINRQMAASIIAIAILKFFITTSFLPGIHRAERE
jgi:hypothetical protein